MHRFILLILLLGACATAPADPTRQQLPTQENVMVSYGDGVSTSIAITRHDYVSRVELHGSRQAVWNALPDAFQEVGLPLPTLDRTRWVAAVQEFRVSQRLGRERLSTFFDCGAGPGGLNADQRRLHLTVFTALEPVDSATTRASVRVDAVAHATSGATMAPITCSSAGQLESRLAVALQRRVLESRQR